ncbi:MAG: hypothetical protein KBD78_10720 [Oligoflexales bacterium]|nr:hypothetical protein [Oligoflexales bacterium]
MSLFKKAQISHPNLKPNALGLLPRDYEAEMSTLCGGCGHDSISRAIILACYESSIEPHRVVKVSGIGCSSKTPGYFLRTAHGINTVHGRMPSIASGAYLANKDLTYLAISGDGDTGSIGIGQFVHAIRRQTRMVYICANNGIYGLTKGQFSATADFAAVNKKGDKNLFPTLDLTALALELGASFVAKSFSGDKHQLVGIIRAALLHKGFSFIDVLSPCVTFNNHADADKSYHRIRRDKTAAFEIADLVPIRESIELEESTDIRKLQKIRLHSGEWIHLLANDQDYDLSDPQQAMMRLKSVEKDGHILTGIIHWSQDATELHDHLKTVKEPLNNLSPESLALKTVDFDSINKRLEL